MEQSVFQPLGDWDPKVVIGKVKWNVESFLEIISGRYSVRKTQCKSIEKRWFLFLEAGNRSID